jgi:membrane protein
MQSGELPLRSATWRSIASRTLQAIQHDNCLGLAAQIAFFFVLALFPTLLFFIALLAFVPVREAAMEVLSSAATVVPWEVITFLREQFEQISMEQNPGLLTISMVGALVSSSAAMMAIIDALNRIYRVLDWRPWWKRQLTAIGLTIVLAAFALLALTFLSIGPGLATRIAASVGLGDTATVLWQILRWPMMVFFAALGVNFVYHYAPDRRNGWVWMSPGAIVATMAWVAASFGFKLYVLAQSEFIATYGAIGGVIATMLWFYVSGLAILTGAELDEVIHRTNIGSL